jgi:hypothetical protein
MSFMLPQWISPCAMLMEVPGGKSYGIAAMGSGACGERQNIKPTGGTVLKVMELLCAIFYAVQPEKSEQVFGE